MPIAYGVAIARHEDVSTLFDSAVLHHRRPGLPVSFARLATFPNSERDSETLRTDPAAAIQTWGITFRLI
ncbi:MAG: hypothetical protein H0U60_19685 [Blastocatellia bacterium]|nr:hypothetical protein [Blastocatellia bacterium]